MDEKIIKKNAVPVIAAMITALAFSFTGLPMDGNTSKYFCRENERCL